MAQNVTPRLDRPIDLLQKEQEDLLGALMSSLQNDDEAQTANEADLLIRIQQNRRAIMLLRKANVGVSLYSGGYSGTGPKS